MEIETGFKKTDVGVLPNDWQLKPLPEIIWFQEGPGLRNWQFKSSGLKVINVTNLEENGFLNLDTTKRHISCDEFEKMYKHFLIDEDDVVIASSGNSYCKTAVVRKQDLPLLMNTSVIRFKPLNGLDYGYMLTYLKSHYFKMQIDLLITGGAQPNFGPAHLRKIFVPLPPTKAEQTAIATALNDADALITQLEKLIVKKLNIKQGAMQELLKPKEGGEVKTFEEIADKKIKWSITGGPFGSNLKSSDYTKDGIRIIQLQNIGDGKFINEYEIFTSQKKADELLSCNIYPNEIILSKMGDPVARACIIPDFHKRYLMCSDGIRLVVDNKLYDSYFIYVYINFSEFRIQAENASTGTTRKRIGLKELKTLEIICPNKSEQTRIAKILSDMDAENEALEKKLEKFKMMKQGMMQNLLTGRIRLV